MLPPITLRFHSLTCRCWLVGLRVGYGRIPVVTRVTTGGLGSTAQTNRRTEPTSATEQHLVDGFQHLAKVRVVG